MFSFSLTNFLLLDSTNVQNNAIKETTSTKENKPGQAQSFYKIPTIEELKIPARTSFECAFCGKTFTYEYALITHEKFLCKLKLE